MKILGTISIILAVLFVLLFIVYFFNLDMKLVAWIYKSLNKRFDSMEKDMKL